MAVGTFTDKFKAKHSLAAVWHDGRWQTINSTPGTGFTTVTCASVWHCVATGITGPKFLAKRVAYEVNGEPPWQSMPPPQRPTSPPSCASLTDCMAIGTVGDNTQGRVVEQWSGTTWKALKAKTTVCGPDGRPCDLDDVSCASLVNCVAVGFAQDDAFDGVRPEAVAWNGSKWTASQPPAGSTPPAMDTAVSCTSAFCLTVGSAADAGNGEKILLASYDATTGQWTARSVSPSLPSTACDQTCFSPGSLSCGSPDNCMEFSHHGNMAWDGSDLRLAPSVSAGTHSLLGAVSCGSHFCMGVGHQTVKGILRPLAELWNGSAWQIIKAP